MFRISLLLIAGVLITLTGCIERYYPDEEDLNTGILVVVAHIDDRPGLQTINLSRSVNMSDASYVPVPDCYVQVTRSDGSLLVFEEQEAGTYNAMPDGIFLHSGADYKLVIITPGGKQYESEFEKLHPAPDIESVYYTVEQVPTADPAIIDEGIQFYLDFEIEKDSGRFLQWELIETYEIQNPDYPTIEYGRDRRWRDVPDSAKFLTCWITNLIPFIYTLDLGNVEGTKYTRMPVNFVSVNSRRLYHRYSLLVRQFALSEKAFWYWNELKKNVQSKGGLFDTQPALTPSNICNIDDENEMVIGYFSVSGCSEKRVFVDEAPGLEINRNPDICAPGIFPMYIHKYPASKLPLYIATAVINGITVAGEVEYECVDCREYKNSTSIKPDFW